MAGMWQLVAMLLAVSSTLSAAQPLSTQQVLTDLVDNRFPSVPGELVVQFAADVPEDVKTKIAKGAGKGRGVRAKRLKDNVEVIKNVAENIPGG